MKIFQIVFESDKFQCLDLKDISVDSLAICLLGESRQKVWPKNLELEVIKPKRPLGIFYQSASAELILTPQAQKDKILVSVLEVNGEFLPVLVNGTPMLWHNITHFSDCVNHDLSRFGPTTGRVPAQLLYPSFDIGKVPLGIHFRLREYPGPRYTATDPSLPPEKDFYQWYHKQGYKGLKFRLLWDSEKPDELIRFY